MSKPSSDLWLDIRNLQLCRAVSLKYIKKISSARYGIENYDDKTKYKCESKDRSYKKIKKHMIISLKKHNGY